MTTDPFKERLRRCLEMRKQGASQEQIAAAIGVSQVTVHRMLKKPEYYSVSRHSTRTGSFGVERDAMAAKLFQQIPKDTRDLTARFCGDPLPGRSALDLRNGGQASG